MSACGHTNDVTCGNCRQDRPYSQTLSFQKTRPVSPYEWSQPGWVGELKDLLYRIVELLEKQKHPHTPQTNRNSYRSDQNSEKLEDSWRNICGCEECSKWRVERGGVA